jgi:CBS domain containing-hemolysin-like protein
LVAALLTLGFTVAAEASLATASRSDLRRLNEEGNRRAKLAEDLLRDPERFLATTLLLKTAGLLAAGAGAARLLPATLASEPLLITLVLAWVLLAALQTSGRSWMLERQLPVALALAPAMRVAVTALWPLTALLQVFDRQTRRDDSADAVETILASDDELRRLMAVEHEEPIEESEKRMIASILEMDETVAREVMVPRMDVVAIDVETTLQAALDIIIAAGHSRIPVYEDTIDRIVGILYAKDLLRCYRDNNDDAPIATLLRPATFVPVSKRVNDLLRTMQKDRVHIAMIVDEYGGIAGLVTIEDILEEIVGEIQDEYDQEEETYVQALGSNRYLFNARLDVYSLAKLLDTPLPNEDADTLGGLIYSVLGHVPEVGEAVEVNGWQFTVLSLDGRRIEEVRAEAVGPRGGHDREDEGSKSDVSAHDDAANPPLLNYSASD